MYKIEITDCADQELNEILEYISVNLQNPSAASSFADEVADCYDALEKTPYMYELSRDPRLHLMGFHKVAIKNYIMIYRVSEEEQTVYILHFFYGARQYEKLI